MATPNAGRFSKSVLVFRCVGRFGPIATRSHRWALPGNNDCPRAGASAGSTPVGAFPRNRPPSSSAPRVDGKSCNPRTPDTQHAPEGPGGLGPRTSRLVVVDLGTLKRPGIVHVAHLRLRIE